MRAIAAILFVFGLIACDGEPQAASEPAGSNVSVPAAEPGVFQPLQSVEVKDAIHRALTTGETQRWQDGAYSGYAVPGPPGKNDCRAVRYTVDQRPEVAFEQITACEAN